MWSFQKAPHAGRRLTEDEGTVALGHRASVNPTPQKLSADG
jgi:hypothetical protein